MEQKHAQGQGHLKINVNPWSLQRQGHQLISFVKAPEENIQVQDYLTSRSTERSLQCHGTFRYRLFLDQIVSVFCLAAIERLCCLHQCLFFMNLQYNFLVLVAIILLCVFVLLVTVAIILLAYYIKTKE